MNKLNDIYVEFTKKASNAGYMPEELVFGFGKTEKGIVLIGEAPGKEEVEKGRPFVGKAGKILDDFLMRSGIERDSLFVTNTVKFRPYKISEKGTVSNRPPIAKEVSFCADCLKKELFMLEPRLIITLGNTPLKAVTQQKNITVGQVHGTVINTGYGRLFAMYHPASLIYNRSLIPVYDEDIKKLASIV